jgi:glycosyltransferase involved in cell wall biosynthesis
VHPVAYRGDVIVVGDCAFGSGATLGGWQMAHALSETNRVLFVDPPASPLAPLRGKAGLEMYRGRPTKVHDRLAVLSPIVHSGRMLPRHAPLVDRLVAAQTSVAASSLGFDDPLIVSFRGDRGLLSGVRRRAFVYWVKDRQWDAPDQPSAHWFRSRHLMVLRAADLVTVVSPELQADAATDGIQATLLPNGCDIQRFSSPRPEPLDLALIARPRAVFVGSWNWRADVDLVATLARRHAGVSFVVVGPQHDALPSAANLHAVGQRSYDEVPAFLQHADVGLIPYRSLPFNRASCPLKLYEYLAAGLPVVASGISAPADVDRSVVACADDVDSFSRALSTFLDGASRKQAARVAAAAHSWRARARMLLEAVDSVVEPLATVG